MSPLLYQLSYTAAPAKLPTYGGRVKRGLGGCAQIVPTGHFASRILQIGWRHNVVAIEHGTGPVPRDPHGHDFGDA